MDLYVPSLRPPAPFGIAPVGDQSQDITPWGGGIEPKMVPGNYPVLPPPLSDDWSLDSTATGELDIVCVFQSDDWPVHDDLGMIFRYRLHGATNWISGSAAAGGDSGISKTGLAAGTYEVEAAWCEFTTETQLSDWTALKSQVVS